MKIVIETTFEEVLEDISNCGHEGYMIKYDEGARECMDKRIKYYLNLLENKQIKIKR